jgi:ATP-binding cassette subfamily F protein uup
MLERICTEFLALDGRGEAQMYASIMQWQHAAARQAADDATRAKMARASGTRQGDSRASDASPPATSSQTRKLSFKEQRDLEGMEEAILQAEAEVESLQALSRDPKIMADHMRLTAVYHDLAVAEQAVRALYDRWAELDARQRAREAERRI